MNELQRIRQLFAQSIEVKQTALPLLEEPIELAAELMKVQVKNRRAGGGRAVGVESGDDDDELRRGVRDAGRSGVGGVWRWTARRQSALAPASDGSRSKAHGLRGGGAL